jgi:carbonic anhydrase
VSAPEAAGEEATPVKPALRRCSSISGESAACAGAPLQVNSFCAYDGSLTTPGCTEDVRWSVLADGDQVSKAAVARLHRVIGQFPNCNGYRNNNRPTQPLNGRIIRLRHGGQHH